MALASERASAADAAAAAAIAGAEQLRERLLEAEEAAVAAESRCTEADAAMTELQRQLEAARWDSLMLLTYDIQVAQMQLEVEMLRLPCLYRETCALA